MHDYLTQSLNPARPVVEPRFEPTKSLRLSDRKASVVLGFRDVRPRCPTPSSLIHVVAALHHSLLRYWMKALFDCPGYQQPQPFHPVCPRTFDRPRCHLQPQATQSVCPPPHTRPVPPQQMACRLAQARAIPSLYCQQALSV